MEQLSSLLDGTVTLCAQLGSSDASQAFAAKQHATAMAVIGTAIMSMEVAAHLASKVQQMERWSPEQKQQLLEVISIRAASAVGQASAGEALQISGRRPLQDFSLLMHYVVPSVWGSLNDCSKTVNSKVEILSRFATSIGLRCPSEPTYSAIVAIVDLVTGETNKTSEEKYQAFRAHKPRIKFCCDSVLSNARPHVVALPADPTVFLTGEWGREAYATELPGACPFGYGDFVAHWKSIPLRVTNIRAAPFAPIQRANASAMQMMGLMHHVLARASHQSNTSEHIPIQILRADSSEALVPNRSQALPHVSSAQQISSSSQQGQPILAIANEPHTSLAPPFAPPPHPPTCDPTREQAQS